MWMDVPSWHDWTLPYGVVPRSTQLIVEEWLISGVDCVLEFVIR